MHRLDLTALAEELRRQNNYGTADPIYIVQTQKRTYGFDFQYVEETVFLDLCNENCEVDFEEYGITKEEAEENTDFEETGFQDSWEFVNAHFTLKAAQRYIDNNNHRHSGELRIYTDTMYRCPEMIAIRKYFMTVGKLSFPVCKHCGLPEMNCSCDDPEFTTPGGTA